MKSEKFAEKMIQIFFDLFSNLNKIKIILKRIFN